MLDQLLNLVKGEAQNAVVDNPDVPNEHNEGIMQEAVSSITNELKNQAGGGGLQNLLQSLTGQGGSQGNSVVNNITGNFANNIMQKFGLNSSTAQSVASSVIPAVMGKLANKTNDANDSSFSLEGIASSLLGGNSAQGEGGGIMGAVKGLFGGK